MESILYPGLALCRIHMTIEATTLRTVIVDTITQYISQPLFSLISHHDNTWSRITPIDPYFQHNKRYITKGGATHPSVHILQLLH